ncbi:MAG: adenosine deaminase [Spirochaetales bacterium]|uniref:Adenosine deaminase n=1 Tax=Candidatus Thalassospirochaeta sargassi TaxID=3119039 RepID=A0AAJ1IBE5_9SPIO|nr:adenosine deaminase [Spirochaetales bacterium]
MSSGNYSFKELIREIPKAEIHLHLEGLISVDTIWNLVQENHLEFDGSDSKENLKKRFNVNSLDEFISLFLNVIQSSFRKEQDIVHLITDAQNYLVRNNIVYAEIFFAPSKFVQSGFSFPHMADILEAGSKKIFEESNITVKFLVDVSRTFGPENAEQNLDLVINNPRKSIIGIGLGGAESKGPAADYKAVFERAIKNNLKVVAHAGEDIGPESIWAALKDLNVDRIGHGISAIQDEELMTYLKDNQIPLEICPTSNLFTKKYVQKIEEHPIKEFYNRGLYVTLNSDDPTLFSSDLCEEYELLYENKIFTEDEIIDIMKKTVYAIYADEKVKKAIWKKAEKVIKKYR